jgi:hypothetical protein
MPMPRILAAATRLKYFEATTWHSSVFIVRAARR